METNLSTPSINGLNQETAEEVGVIVGRFQTPRLHQGHRELISRVTYKHKQLLIFLGVSPNKRSRRDPLDFEARRLMILEMLPMACIQPLSDMKDDSSWSAQLDGKITELYPFSKVRLYGGRDSFLAHYRGKFPTTEIEANIYHSATSLRDIAGKDIKNSADWRAGVIYGAYNQYPKCWPTVDVAPIRYNEDNTVEVLLAKKPGEEDWRFIGGFVDPVDLSYERAAKRETMEEAGIETDDYKYIASVRINDWRYRNDIDKIITTFFHCRYIFGCPNPKDDIEQVGWFVFGNGPRAFQHVAFVDAHQRLREMLMDVANKEGWFNETTKNKSSTS